MSKRRLGGFRALLIVFLPTWIIATAVTATIAANSHVATDIRSPAAGIGMMAVVTAIGLATSLLATLIAVVGYRTSDAGIGAPAIAGLAVVAIGWAVIVIGNFAINPRVEPETPTTVAVLETLPGPPVSSTALPDIAPPALTLDGDAVTIRAVRSPIELSGSCEAGADLVMAAVRMKCPASGRWSVTVSLAPGSQHFTFTATDGAGNSTDLTREVVLEPQVVLRENGIGGVAFGTPEEVALPELLAILGAPNRSELETVAVVGLPFGYGARTSARLVSWDVMRVSVVFTDGDYFRTDGVMHLVSWDLLAGHPTSIATAEGASTESTLDQIIELYGNSVLVAPDFEEGSGGWPLWIEGPAFPMMFVFDTDPHLEGSTPFLMHGGALGT